MNRICGEKKLRFIGFIIFVFTTLGLAGCGGGGGESNNPGPDQISVPDTTPDTTAPAVSSTAPAAGATGVAVNTTVQATFSEAVDPATITTATFTLTQGTISGAGTVIYPGNIDTDNSGSQYAWGENVGWINFKPSYGPGVTVTASSVTGYAWGENVRWIHLDPTNGGVINDGAGHLSGYAWGENVGWINFAPAGGGVSINATTGAFSGKAWGENIGWISFDLTGSIAPYAAETSWRSDSPPNQAPITLTQGTTSVAGTVSLSADGKSATFTPSESLAFSTDYTATITTGVKDAAGNPLAAEHLWIFTTGDAPPAPLPPPDSTAPATPTGLSLLPPSPANDNFPKVLGSAEAGSTVKLYTDATCASAVAATGSAAEFASPGLTITVADNATTTFHATATDAAGNRSPCSAGITYVEDSAAPANTTAANFINVGLEFTSSTAVNLSISATDNIGVTGYYASESATAPSPTAAGWTAVGPTTSFPSTTVSFTLSGGDGAKTVHVWFKDAAGNISLAVSDSLTLDTTRPTVLSTAPVAGATSAAVNTSVSATFSEAVDPATINTSTFTLKTAAGSPAAGTVALNPDGKTATFTPSASLAFSTTYTATITTGVKDLAGNPLAADFVWNFTTEAAVIGVIERVSVATDGTQGNGLISAPPSISADGRYVAFQSQASNLVAGDTNLAADVFVRDTCLGAPVGCVPSTIRASVATDGTQANTSSLPPVMSANGRYVAFESGASTLVPTDADGGAQDVFVRDTCIGAPAGCTPFTFIATDGNPERGINSSISPDGRYVGFDRLGIHLRDTCLGAVDGCTPSTVLVQAGAAGAGGRASISAGGRYVAFNSFSQISVRDTCIGAPAGCTPSTTPVSVAPDGTAGNAGSQAHSISSDGRYVAFASGASNLVDGDTNLSLTDIFVRDTCFGAPPGCVPSTILVSVSTDGIQGNSFSEYPSISAGGRYVAFDSGANNLVAGDTSARDVFVRDTCLGAPAGCVPSTVRVNVTSNGTQDNCGAAGLPSISADGRYVAFSSCGTNLVTGDTNNFFDVFLAATGFPAE
ncbi:Ig-like domain-containing protein [Candidatus Manganitrophus noduliformans]|nr:Ig-like domain-containing protein [Candidatus Manganitrophus noduliformans]